MRVCICGAGIAGLTTAWWLERDGHEVTVVERAPALRDEGYMLDFFGSGWDVAARMDLLERLEQVHYPIAELQFVRPNGSHRTTIPYPRVRALFSGRHFNFMRGDLERVLFEALPDPSIVRFGTTLDAIDDGSVSLSSGERLEVDLVVGADGVRSAVREHVAPGADPIRPLGFHTAAHVVTDPDLRAAHPDAFQTLTVPGRQVATYPIRGGKVASFFVWSDAHHPDGENLGAGATLRRVYGDLGWRTPELLARLPDDADIYFDAVAQVVLEPWHRGSTVLVGDACQAVSLLAGQGASMAMGGAWALAKALREQADVPAALRAYEALVRPAIETKQAAGRKMAAWFVPASRPRIWLRDVALSLSTKPGMGWLMRSVVSGDSIVT